MGDNHSFSDRLNSEEVKHIFDCLNIPWRDFNAKENGWIHIPEYAAINGWSGDFGINILNGGWIDHRQVAIAKKNGWPLTDYDSGDIVDLVRLMVFNEVKSKQSTTQAIEWIRKKLGYSDKVPILSENQMCVKDYIANGLGFYAMVPTQIVRNKELNASAKIVWIAIQERCGKGKHYSFPGINKISNDTGLGRSTVQRAIDLLKKSGYLVEMERSEGRSPRRYPLVKTDESN